MSAIRNFVIIAHIDHGKSTLADRFLEITGTVAKRQMRAQYLDQLELERERGITIKMAPVRMSYLLNRKPYILNLIDTPGHSDFSYEVSRALTAVEGAILLVDATQGVQAQTLANFNLALAAGLKIIGAVNKIDVFEDRNDPILKKTVIETAEFLNVSTDEIFLVSGKTGEGAEKILEAIVEQVPPPKQFLPNHSRALIFDSFYDNHKGVIASVRVFDGEFKNEDEIHLIAAETKSRIKEVGFFKPELKPMEKLEAGDIGYLATGIKDPKKIKIGDTVSGLSADERDPKFLMLPGYKEPKPVVFVSFYPENNDDYDLLARGLQKLRLNDSALTIEPDQNEVLGRGFKLGFLGRLHYEIIGERLKREFGLKTVNTFPSALYKVKTAKDWLEIIRPEEMPGEFTEIWEPMVKIEIILPNRYLNDVFPLQSRFRLSQITTESFAARVRLKAVMPLAELVSDFDDQLKSATQGYASFSYEISDYNRADIARVDVILAGKMVPGLSRFLPKDTLEREGRRMVLRLKNLLPRQQFAQAIQAVAGGRVIAREDIAAMRKDVTGYLYGGDRSRKMKLWQKQKRGKKKLKERAEAKISPEIFKELLKH
ncbi:MAG: translation elongation factor 4 [Patescibacteria group bacterium]